MNLTQEQYFNFGVDMGKAIYEHELHGNSYLASIFDEETAKILLKKVQIGVNRIFPHQEIIAKGIKLGVLTGGVK